MSNHPAEPDLAGSTIRVVCVTCGTMLEALSKSIGKFKKCPKCSTMIQVPEPSAIVVGSPGPPPMPQTFASRAPTSVEEPKKTALESGNHLVSRIVEVLDTNIIPPLPRVAHRMGVASLVVGVLSVLISLGWVPGPGLIVGGLGMLLALGGLVPAARSSGNSMRFSIAGLALSVLSIALGFIWTTDLGDVFRNTKPDVGGEFKPLPKKPETITWSPKQGDICILTPAFSVNKGSGSLILINSFYASQFEKCIKAGDYIACPKWYSMAISHMPSKGK